MKMRPFGRLLPWETALARLLSAIVPVTRRESVPTAHALGRVVAQDYRALSPVPPFPRATWDGYAFRARSTQAASRARPRSLRIVGEVFADGGHRRRLAADEAVAIATGGMLPPGADAVIRFESVRVRGAELTLSSPVQRGDAVAGKGEDLPKGARVVRAGRVLSPADLGALALTGVPEVSVWGRPVVGVLPNGNELTLPGRPLGRGQIYESNNATLSGVIEAQGGEARGERPVRDEPARIEAAIRRALGTSDLLVVTGGSSVGERDYLPTIFPKLGRLLFHGIAIRPGKPTLAVRVGSKVVIGMPGHPTACLSNGFWLLAPAVGKLAHRPDPFGLQVSVRLSRSVDLPTSGLATVIPLEVRGAVARPTFRDSSAISSLGEANAFALWPGDRPAPRRGDRLLARLLLPPTGSLPVRAPRP